MPVAVTAAAAPAYAASCIWRISLRETKTRQPTNNCVDDLGFQVCIDPNNFQPACVNNNLPWPGTTITLRLRLPLLYYTGAWTLTGTGYSPLSGTGTLVGLNYEVTLQLNTGATDAPGTCWEVNFRPAVRAPFCNPAITLPNNILSVTISGNADANFFVHDNNTVTAGTVLFL
jgi:hypothetical protein